MLTEQLQNFNIQTRVRTVVGIVRDRNVVISIITVIIRNVLYRNNFNLEENEEPNRSGKDFVLTALNLLWHKSQIEAASFPLSGSSLLTSSTLLLILMTLVPAWILRTRIILVSSISQRQRAPPLLSTTLAVSCLVYRQGVYRRVLFYYNYAHSQNCQKRLLASSYMSVRLSAWNKSVPNERIFIKFDIWVYFEKLSRKFEFH